MKEYLFRGKRKDNGEWVYGYYYAECGNTYIIENRQKKSLLCRNQPHLVIPETIGQFTGLTDKDNHEIFQDDLRITNDGVVFRIYRTTGGFVIKSSIWMSNLSYLGIGDDLVLDYLADPQTKGWIIDNTKHYKNLYD